MSIHRITAVRLYFIPVETRVPLKFGTETLTSVTIARAALAVVDEQGRTAEGWGETPLSVQWVWPSKLPYTARHGTLKDFCAELASAWVAFRCEGHPLEIGCHFQNTCLRDCLRRLNSCRDVLTHMPWLAALVCNSPFDIALHDAFGKLVHRPVYQTYGSDLVSTDLACFLEPADCNQLRFRGKFPADFLSRNPPKELAAWHLVGGLDPLEHSEITSEQPEDGYPVTLGDWIQRDGLKCVKVKLRGNDSTWDYSRLLKVGEIALQRKVEWLSADFNCTVHDPAYVNEILDRLRAEKRSVYDKILYVEQPFPYELEEHRIDVHSVSARKPLFLDESAHDWRMIKLGRELGWTGVALKTCKTQTGAILSACWAKAHGMGLMVQDLTNPMLAQIPHVLLAAHVGTIMGVETNAMQFYPEASRPEQRIHPGLFQRCGGKVDLATIRGDGFGYRLEEIGRHLPEPAVSIGE